MDHTFSADPIYMFKFIFVSPTKPNQPNLNHFKLGWFLS